MLINSGPLSTWDGNFPIQRTLLKPTICRVRGRLPLFTARERMGFEYFGMALWVSVVRMGLEGCVGSSGVCGGTARQGFSPGRELPEGDG